jgi:nucleoside-diphosphate-sugar epimerase
MKGLTARLFTVYGPGEHEGRLLPSLLETAKTGKPLRLTAGQQRRDFTYVEDAADGLLRLGLSASEPGEVVNLATGTLNSVRAFAGIAADELEIPPDKLQFGAIPVRGEEMKHSEVSVKRLLLLTSWIPPTTITQGIQKTVSFMQRRENELSANIGK